jgi:glyoxylase-like metal-dependent hydrolase (beta-lactamase superfamily II)
MAVAISSRGEQLLCIGDTPLHPINLEQPDWYAAVDLDPELIAATKRRLFDRAATEKAMVFGAHFPPPSLGHVIEKEEAWQWEPIERRG